MSILFQNIDGNKSCILFLCTSALCSLLPGLRTRSRSGYYTLECCLLQVQQACHTLQLSYSSISSQGQGIPHPSSASSQKLEWILYPLLPNATICQFINLLWRIWLSACSKHITLLSTTTSTIHGFENISAICIKYSTSSCMFIIPAQVIMRLRNRTTTTSVSK